jgi:hypothetical protein
MLLAERIVKMLAPGNQGGWGMAKLSTIAYQMNKPIDKIWPTVEALEAAGRIRRTNMAGYEEWMLA